MFEHLFGIMPPPTPLTAGGELDEAAVRQEARYMIERGVLDPSYREAA